ncbi:hypothetical protein B0T20DRAFT_268946 [Sordaria brevicollis]|uniref:Uncharacterized protein n=1 Tax=Sordaria brevicollis TaxID=83679 RepID=A0AAE0PAH1_SORBR|nr:hypothetical protein B0T20DRAFT_268946 [Sordaria brevicollis]
MPSHATPGPAAKRRRVELANATLRRPFRSPMIKNRSTSGDMKSTPTATRLGKGPTEPGEVVTPHGGGGGGGGGTADVTEGEGGKEDDNDNDDNDADTSFETSFSSVTMPEELRKAPTRSGIISQKRKSNLGLGSTPTVTSISSKKRPSSLGQGHTTKVRTRTVVGEAQGPDGGDGHDDILAKLQKTHRATKVHLVAMQKQLDLTRQAKRIEMASRKKTVAEEGSKKRLRRNEDATTTMVIDAELKELVQKWKLASRQAAEDLFELIKGRVADMGGAKAWRETRRRQMEGFNSAWEEDDRPKGGKKRREDDEEREIADSDAASDDDGFDDDGGLSYQRTGNNDDEKSVDDDCEDSGFTMLMMLQSLNIEPDVLGYDLNEDKWLD